MNTALLTASLVFSQFIYQPPEPNNYGYALSGGYYCIEQGNPYWWCRNWHGVGFTVQDVSTITGIEGLIQSEIAIEWEQEEGEVVLGFYNDSAGVPGQLLDSWSFSMASGFDPPVWNGVTNLELQIDAGTYWITFEVPPTSKFVGGILTGSELFPTHLPGGPNNRDASWIRDTGDAAMVRIYGTQANEGLGDFNQNGIYDPEDFDMISQAILDLSTDVKYDLTFDGSVNLFDRLELQQRAGGIQAGDANVDGLFNTTDLIQVFQFGEYETGGRALWSEGDWTGNGEFGTDDLVAAFQTGVYEQPQSTVSAVPEMTSLLLIAMGMVLLVMWSRG